MDHVNNAQVPTLKAASLTIRELRLSSAVTIHTRSTVRALRASNIARLKSILKRLRVTMELTRSSVPAVTRAAEDASARIKMIACHARMVRVCNWPPTRTVVVRA